MTMLILIRHGETDYNLEKRYCGFNDPPLNKKGIWQAKKLAKRLKSLKIDKVYSSDLKRAYQSAELISEDNPIEKVSDFREMNFGIFEGLKYDDIIKTHPELYRSWIKNPVEAKMPDGENLTELYKRVMRKLSFILSENEDKTIALVTHGGPIRAILCNALRFGLEKFWQIEQEIGALNIIDYSKGSAPAVVKMNDASHLSNHEEAAP